MNKITIPALLLGVVMIAGAFAFMPVQEASTVHTGATTTLAADAITAAKIADASITADQIATDAIGALEIAANAIGAAEIADSSIDAATFVAAAVNAAAIATDAIGSDELAATAVIEIQTKRIDTVSFTAGQDPTCTSTTPFVVHYNVANLGDTQTLVISGTSNAALTYTTDANAATEALQLLSGTLGGAAGETIIFTIGAAGTSAMTIVSTTGSTGTCAA